MDSRWRFVLTGLGARVAGHAVLVLGFVATAPDIRLRFLLEDEHRPEGHAGLTIRATPGLENDHCKGLRPEAGDELLRLGDEPISSFLDFSRAMVDLHGATVPGSGLLDPGADPLELGHLGLPNLIEETGTGRRWLEVEFRRRGESGTHVCWLLVRSLPFGEVVVTFVWLLLQLGVLLVSGLALWNRPFDRPVRLFFGVSILTLGAFVGGYHWWVVAGSHWLNLPFVVCATVLPATTLHFLVVHPRPQAQLSRNPVGTIVAIYALPVVMLVVFLGLLIYAARMSGLAAEHRGETGMLAGALLQQARTSLGVLRRGVYVYFAVASVYYGLAVGILISRLVRARNPLERSQVRWLAWAAVFATVPFAYALFLAYADRVSFALGGARFPMFVASLSLTLAYAVSIVRSKLSLVDQIASKGMLYYVTSGSVTVAFALVVTVVALGDDLAGWALTPQQLLALVPLGLITVIVLLWLRDFAQQIIDRRFFREKYQLDKTLERMNRAIGHLVDPEALGNLMLGSCRDALRVEHAALYLRSEPAGNYQLVQAEGFEPVPVQFAPSPDFLQTLREFGSLQRVTPGTRSEMSPAQHDLRTLHAELVHALEVDGRVQGLVVLGEKPNGAPFTAEDLTFLNAVGQITNVALHSAKIHQDVARLNEELHLKSERIDDQRRQIAILQTELAGTLPEPATPSDDGEPAEFRRGPIKGESAAIREVLQTVRKVAHSESSVLIRGESGTGKELLAQVLHDNSPRSGGPLVSVHCASLSPSLLESELFGHVKGAFTGAHKDKVGRFQMADGGSLFLDEIGDISLETQVKLLRVLQERRFEPVGGTRTVRVDVRLITATHQNLEQLIADGRFREDLYYRLNVISITLPPLRERNHDVFELVRHFLARAAKRLGKRVTRIEDDALVALERYHWPGNIRELENAVERALVLSDGDAITLADLPAELQAGAARSRVGGTTAAGTARIPAAERSPTFVEGNGDGVSERRRLEAALRECGGNKAQAARLLEMPRSTYYSKLKRYAIS